MLKSKNRLLSSYYQIILSTESGCTAYYLAKYNRPFSDHENMVELQELNHCNLGCILHSRFSATSIINHISAEMQAKLVSELSSSGSSLSVLIDESSTLSHLSAMVVFIKASINGSDPVFIFLALVELESQTAEIVTSSLITCLKTAGFSESYLQKHWISFVSDGASVMVGKQSGIATRLREQYPCIFAWHCMNYRLELAVGDAVKEVTAVNSFKAFLDSLYSLFSQSNKNKRELSEACKELELQMLSIGRVGLLDMRWVASSLRTVHAVWTCYPALHRFFVSAAHDASRDGTMRSKFTGLASRLASPQFVGDLGVMYDVLQELSFLSLELQKTTMTLSHADHLVKRTIRVLESFKESPGQHMEEAMSAQTALAFMDVQLQDRAKMIAINSNQLIQSVANNLRRRLSDDSSADAHVVKDSSILETSEWPHSPDVRYGEKEVRRLSLRFGLDAQEAVLGMRDFIDDRNTIPPGLKKLYLCLKTLPCSTAECERGFSLMNIIATELRSVLLIKNISSLMFIHLNGPPLKLWSPAGYVRSWIVSHRSATDTQSRKRATDKHDSTKLDLWSIFNK